MVTFTKNKQTGDYDVIGPADELREGAVVTVTCRSGKTKQVTVGRASRPFTAKFGPLKGQKAVIAKVGRRAAISVPDGYYMRGNEILACGCAECRRLGRLCPQCEHDFM